jgi:hypothetical protein
MGHVMDRCDYLDVLEESVTLKRPIQVELKGGKRFVDAVKELVTAGGEDWAVFRDHDRVAVSEISFCGRAP